MSMSTTCHFNRRKTFRSHPQCTIYKADIDLKIQVKARVWMKVRIQESMGWSPLHYIILGAQRAKGCAGTSMREWLVCQVRLGVKIMFSPSLRKSCTTSTAKLER